MDLGIAGRKAIVCASSRGLGKACARALAEAGCEVVINGRDAKTLNATAAELSGLTGAKITAVAADVATAEGQKALLAACPQPDILINNASGPPLGDWRSFTREQWLDASNSNMVAAILLTRAVIDGMAERGFGRVLNITSAMVKAPLAPLALSVAARLGLTGFVKSIAAGYIKSNVTLNNLLPEMFETDRLRSNLSKLAASGGRSLDEEMAARKAASPARRFGRVDEFGAVCAFYCSQHAGYLTGQNVMLDGGMYPGTF